MGIYGGVERRIAFSERRMRNDRRTKPEGRRQWQDLQWLGEKDRRTDPPCRRTAPIDRRESTEDRRS
jgi:hypothetical protein